MIRALGGVAAALLAASATPGALLARQAAPATPSVVVGVVVDHATGAALPSATLELLGTPIRGPASPDGRFRLPPLPPGPLALRVNHPGYAPRVDTLMLGEGQRLDVRVALRRDTTYAVAPLLVEVRSRVLERRGFYERQAQGYAARYFTKDDIRDRNPQNVTELFVDLPGMMLIPGDLDGPQLVFQRATSMRDSGVCRPALFLDGVKSQIRLYDMILDPTHLEGVEVYVGAGVPGQFNDPCGAVLIWTR